MQISKYKQLTVYIIIYNKYFIILAIRLLDNS